MDFPSNSEKGKARPVSKDGKPVAKKKAPEKNIEKVVTGEATKKPKSAGRRAKDVIFGEEFKAAAHYVMNEVLIPAVRNLIVDTTTKGIERVIYGDNAPRRSGAIGSGGRYSYNAPVNRGVQRRGNLPDQSTRFSTNRRKHNVDDILLKSRSEAEIVVERLLDIIDTYDCASVADLYELVGFPSSYIDNQWGWFFLHPVNVRQVREGYLIDLPPVEPI